MAAALRVQGCKLLGHQLFLLLAEGPVTLPSLCCLVAVAQEVLQRKGTIYGEVLHVLLPIATEVPLPFLRLPTKVPHNQDNSSCGWRQMPCCLTTQEPGPTYSIAPKFLIPSVVPGLLLALHSGNTSSETQGTIWGAGN